MKLRSGVSPVLLAAAWTVASASEGTAGQWDNLKDGEGVEVVREQCLACHDDSYIVSLRLPREEWEEVLEIMVGMGMMPLEGELRETVLGYLSTAQGVDEPEGSSDDADAAEEPSENAGPDLPWAEPRYAPTPLAWRRPAR